MGNPLLSGSEVLLKLVAEKGELSAQAFLAHVPRPTGTYRDFFPVAALLRAGYIATDASYERLGEKVWGKLGITAQDTAVSFVKSC